MQSRRRGRARHAWLTGIGQVPLAKLLGACTAQALKCLTFTLLVSQSSLVAHAWISDLQQGQTEHRYKILQEEARVYSTAPCQPGSGRLAEEHTLDKCPS